MSNVKNTVTVQVDFSFKGESFSPEMVLELDLFAKINEDFSSLYSGIARKNNIDTYSYAFEVMEASPLVFHSPTGNVVDYITDGQCDLLAYREFIKGNKIELVLEKIALDKLGIDDIHHGDHATIKSALEQAYQAGKQ